MTSTITITTITFVANIPFQTRTFFILIKDWPKPLTWGPSGSSNPSCIVKCNQCNATTPFCRLTCHFWDSLTRVVSRVYPSLSPGGNSARHCLGTSSQPMCSNVAVYTIAMCSNLLNPTRNVNLFWQFSRCCHSLCLGFTFEHIFQHQLSFLLYMNRSKNSFNLFPISADLISTKEMILQCWTQVGSPNPTPAAKVKAFDLNQCNLILIIKVTCSCSTF